MVEDVVTTGLSSREAMEAVRAAGGEILAEAALVDRSAGNVDLGVPFYPLVAINFPTYASDDLPEALAASPAIKPGSRSPAACAAPCPGGCGSASTSTMSRRSAKVGSAHV